jgi:uncharacterized protein DUF6883
MARDQKGVLLGFLCLMSENVPQEFGPIPGADDATADPRKFTDYLLNLDHAVGGGKAKFFREAGYNERNWEQLRDELLAQLPNVEARFSRSIPPHGNLYEVRMTIEAPNGPIRVRTIWRVHPIVGTTLVTAYPL